MLRRQAQRALSYNRTRCFAQRRPPVSARRPSLLLLVPVRDLCLGDVVDPDGGLHLLWVVLLGTLAPVVPHGVEELRAVGAEAARGQGARVLESLVDAEAVLDVLVPEGKHAVRAEGGKGVEGVEAEVVHAVDVFVLRTRDAVCGTAGTARCGSGKGHRPRVPAAACAPRWHLNTKFLEACVGAEWKFSMATRPSTLPIA
mmetsp:Transcript_656/g.2190  ORF Transcript_656/g.2190 Transcript_656/m.2190 type:complete len:200 (+) Transcript_656:1141-1740(+)